MSALAWFLAGGAVTICLVVVYATANGVRLIRVRRAERVVQVTLFSGEWALIHAGRVNEWRVR